MLRTGTTLIHTVCDTLCYRVVRTIQEGETVRGGGIEDVEGRLPAVGERLQCPKCGEIQFNELSVACYQARR